LPERSEHDCWTAFARAKDIERAPADIDGSADFRIPPAVSAVSDPFKKNTCNQQCENADRNQFVESVSRGWWSVARSD